MLLVGKVAEAQALQVIPVPWVATDPSVPHQAYNDHVTTLKAIARGGSCASYGVEWDPEGDGTYDATLAFSSSNRYDLSRRFQYPDQVTTTTFNATIRVTCGASVVTGVYPVRIFADVPLDPAGATDRQLQVMRGVAVDDGLWYLHNRLIRSGDEANPLTGAQASGYIPNDITTSYGHAANTSGFLWALSLNGHFAAFPSAYIGQLPAGNNERFAEDPYAEDAMRVVNYLLTQFTIVTTIPAADESNRVGFYPEVTQAPIFGTDDGVGFHITTAAHDSYITGHVLSGFAVSNLQGYVSQVGDPTYVLGRRLEYVVQQITDAMVFGQVEGAAQMNGSWGYAANQAIADTSSSLWGLTGIWHAAEFADDMGVIVPNIARARAAQFAAESYTVPAAGHRCVGYRPSYTQCGLAVTALQTLTMGWVGANTFDPADTRVAFPSYNSITRGQLRTHHDQVLAWISANFNNGGFSGGVGWNPDFMGAGGFANTARQGNHYAMLHWQDAARAVEPEIVTFGGNNWIRLFSQYLINNQETNGRWQSTIWDANNSDYYGSMTLNTVWSIAVLSPDAIPPLAIAEASSVNAPEGTPITFDGTDSDPGTGNPTYSWNFDNGSPVAAGQVVTYAFPDDDGSPFDVTLTATSIGGTSTDTVVITITNVAPIAAAGGDLVVAEGTAQAFNVVVTDPGTGDTHTYLWDFDDGTATDASQNPSHTFADNGSYLVTVDVADDDLGTDQDDVNVTVTNVNPAITSSPITTATEGQLYTYTVIYNDPGSVDTHTCTLATAPQGMTIDPATCVIDWTPSFTQALGASAPVNVCVTDNDLGQACQAYTITVTFVDTDNDGLPDSWEVANFGDITSEDQFGDPDGDGMNNLQEFNNVTDPNVYNGPDAPVALSPVCGSEIATFQTNLVVTNATDPDPLFYEFELFSDIGLTIPVASEDNIPEGGAGTTTWAVPVNLSENQTYYWRARAEDNFTFGPYTSPICDFFVNTVNEAPGVPRINTPSFGAQVNSLTPDLTVDNATDPDQDILTYEFEVYTDPALSTLVASQLGVASGATTTTWTVDTSLTEDTFYYWRVRATDPDDLSGDWSNSGQFFVTTVSSPPESPVLVSPLDASVVAELRPVLLILNADDADFDPLVYDWQLASDDTFATILESGDDVAPQGDVTTAFTLSADLEEDTRYCWRARSDDGGATSSYSTACFLISAVNDPPSVPTLMNPSSDSIARTLTPTFSWAPSTDPEGSVVRYDVEVMNVDGDVVATAEGVSGTVTAMGELLEDGEDYTWHARAVDLEGEVSQFSEPNDFVVLLPEGEGGSPDIVVNGGGCSASGGASAGGLALLGLGVIAGLRRRRRR